LSGGDSVHLLSTLVASQMKKKKGENDNPPIIPPILDFLVVEEGVREGVGLNPKMVHFGQEDDQV